MSQRVSAKLRHHCEHDHMILDLELQIITFCWVALSPDQYVNDNIHAQGQLILPYVINRCLDLYSGIRRI